MDPVAFETYTRRLRSSLESAKGVLGLVTLGTTADPELRDEFSDHDFWVITEPGVQDSLIGDLSWLPDAQNIALTVSHGPRRRTVLYDNRHKVEFAVFNPEEARQQGTVQRFAILFDRDQIEELIQSIRLESLERIKIAQTKSDLLHDLCVIVWSACERYTRGELLSSRQYLDQFALNKYLILQSGIEGENGIDGLEPRRRLEVSNPALAAELLELLAKPVPHGALHLLEIMEREVKTKKPELDWQSVSMLKTWISEML